MLININVPNLPESVQDATLMDWHKKPGDKVSRGEALVDLETDKVVLEVPAPDDGILQSILKEKGAIVSSQDLLAILDTEGVSQVPAAKPAIESISETSEPKPVKPSPAVSPAVRRLLAEHQLDAAQITGGSDRLSKQDVLDYLEAQAKNVQAEAVEAPQIAQAPSPVIGKRGERRVTMTRLRSRIAERMVESQQSTATLTTFNEVNLQKIFELRNSYKNQFEKEHKIKLGFMSFFVKASVEALKRFPILNASIENESIVYHDYYDIGLAVSTDRGLVVPVLRDADKLGFAEIEKSVIEFATKARDGKLSYEELTGGTFSITNGGIYGSMLSTPILNPPQAAILGMHAIKERPIVENGQIVIRPMIYLALSYDHRLIDGKEAVQFLFTIKELLEDPVRMVLNV